MATSRQRSGPIHGRLCTGHRSSQQSCIVDRLGFVFGDLLGWKQFQRATNKQTTTTTTSTTPHSRNFPRNPQNPNVVRSFSFEKCGFSTGTAVESSLMILKTDTARTQDFCTTEIRYAHVNGLDLVRLISFRMRLK